MSTRILRFGRALIAFVFATCLASGAAHAADKTPPVITHVRVDRAPLGAPLRIKAKIDDESEVFAPSISVRPKGAKQFESVDMRKVGDAYEGMIPAEQMIGDLEYFIEAFDEHGNGPAREGSPQSPIYVRAYDPSVAPPPPPPDPVVTTPPTMGEEDDDEAGGGGVHTKWWFWTIIGAAVAGGGATVFLLSRPPPTVDAVDIRVRGPDPAGLL